MKFIFKHFKLLLLNFYYYTDHVKLIFFNCKAMKYIIYLKLIFAIFFLKLVQLFRLQLTLLLQVIA